MEPLDDHGLVEARLNPGRAAAPNATGTRGAAAASAAMPVLELDPAAETAKYVHISFGFGGGCAQFRLWRWCVYVCVFV